MKLNGRGVVCMCGSAPRISSCVFQLQSAKQTSSHTQGFLIKTCYWPGKPYSEDMLPAVNICLHILSLPGWGQLPFHPPVGHR